MELPACPVETTLMLIGDKWKVLILRDLMDGTNWVVRIPASNFAPEGALFGFPMSGGAPVFIFVVAMALLLVM